MNQLELLSPAGDLQIFKAVVNVGADAVYFGGDLFGARAYAKNFSIEEAAEAIRYALAPCVFPSLSEFSTVYCGPHSQRLWHSQ